MTNDASPQIGGQANDTSPMISSVETRVIADARGAYLARNLDALIGHMTDDQRHHFQRALVEMALYYFEPLPPEDWSGTYRDSALEVAHAFLAAPTPEAARTAVEASHMVHNEPLLEHTDDWNPAQEYLLDDRSLALVRVVRSLLPAATHKLASTAAMAAGFPFQDRGATYLALLSIFKQRMVEAGWALLQGKDASLARPVLRDELDAVLSDAARLYRDRNFPALIRLMNEAQQMRFKQIVVRESLALAESLLPENGASFRINALLDAAQRWLDDPNVHNTQMVAALEAAMPRGIEHHILIHNPDGKLYQAACNAVAAAAEPNFGSASDRALYGVEFPDGTKKRNFEAAEGTSWRLDTAWAILQGHEPPIRR